MTHNILLIVPSAQSAREIWADTGVGNWAAAFPLRLERAGLLDFDVTDERALDAPDELAGRGLVIVAHLPATAWTEGRREALHSFAGSVFLEGPAPPAIFAAPTAAAAAGPPAIMLGTAGSEPIPLDLPPPQTRPMRIDPSLIPVAADTTLEERLAVGAVAYAAQYCRVFTRHHRLFPTGSASAMAALAVALVAERSAGASYVSWLQAGTDEFLALLPEQGVDPGVWPIAAAMITATRTGALPALPADTKVPMPAPNSAVWNVIAPAAANPAAYLGPPVPGDRRLRRAGAFALWSIATFQRGEISAAASSAALALVEAVTSGKIEAETEGVDVWASVLLAGTAWRAAPRDPTLREIWQKALAASVELIAPFRLGPGGCTLAGPPSDSPFCALALASMCERITLPLPAPTEGLDTNLAPAGAWYRTSDMGAAFAGVAGDVLARRASDGAPMVVRDGRLCASSVPLLGWLCRAYSAPPLEGTFVNRPMRQIKQLEAWLIDLLVGLATASGRPMVRVASWPAGKTFACTIAHDVDRIPASADFDRLLDWERGKGLKSSWYWMPSRLDAPRMEQIIDAGFEIGLHAILAARKHQEVAAVAAALPAMSAIRGETMHGGPGADHWRGAASVLQAHACGFAYTEHCPTAHDLPEAGFAILSADGEVEAVPIIGLTHAVCLERNPEKEEEVYHRESLERLAAAGGYCLVSNHPDLSFPILREWIEGLPLDRAWHATAAEVADWWRASHDRAGLDLRITGSTADETEISVTSRCGVAGLVLRLPVRETRKVSVDGAKLVRRQDREAWVAVDVPRGETRIIRARASDTLDRIAIVGPPGAAVTDDPAIRAALGGSPASARLVHLSHRARHLDPARATAANPAFLFGPLDEPVDLMVVLRRASGIFPNAFTAAWLGTLLADGDTQEILIEHGGEAGGRTIAEALRRWLPEAAIGEEDERWIRLERCTGMADRVNALPTAYPFLHRAFPGFRDTFAIARPKGAHLSVSSEGPAEAAFTYSMLGASRNSFVLERLAQRLAWGPTPHIVDIGGGHGFLGVELASKGWAVTVVDYEPAKTESLGPWLARRSLRPLPIEFHTLSMEAIAERGMSAAAPPPQAITFFQCLYLARRDRVKDILRACWNQLAEGGALVIHELVRQGPGEYSHERRFARDELIQLVTEGVASPSFVSIQDGEPMAEFRPGTTALVVLKSNEAPALRQSEIETHAATHALSSMAPRSEDIVGAAGLVLRLPVRDARKVSVDGAKLVTRQDGEAWVAVDVPRGETRIIRTRASATLDRVAIAGPPGAAVAEDPAIRAALGASAASARLVHLCDRARHLDPARATAADPAFLFGPLDEPVDQMVVLRRASGIFPNAFTAAWLGTLLADGDTQQALIERNREHDRQEMAGALRRWLPEAAVSDADERWIRLDHHTGVAEAVAAVPTAYPFLHRAFAGFRDLYAIVKHKDAAEFVSGEGPAEAAFMYSMLGASRNSFVLERLAQRLAWGPTPSIVDIGGGHGFLGVELASKGWAVTVVDHDPAKTELLGPWLARRSLRPLPIEFHTLSMEAIAEGGMSAAGPPPQAITFFQCLYLAQRDRVKDILRACWDQLAEGGALVIHELVRQAPGEHLHEQRFARDELIQAVAESVASPSFVSIQDGEAMDEFRPGTTVLLARKPGMEVKPLQVFAAAEPLANVVGGSDDALEMDQPDAIPAAATVAELTVTPAPDVGGVSVRPFPWPYRCMLAICSDIDMTTPAKFAAVHRFLNTRDETPFGQGVGLDVADSFWFYSLPGSARNPADQQMSYFTGLDWRQRSPFAEQILDYIRGGWIDTLHTYGNFSTLPAGSPGCTREHAERALAVLDEARLKIGVWANHGNNNNIQNIGASDYMVGDVPRNPNQHSHLLYRHGVRFMWSGLVSGEFRRDTVISPAAMRDGRTMWRFSRQDFAYSENADELAQRFGAVTGLLAGRSIAMVWHPRLMHLQLSPENLADLVAKGGYAILGQHFGAGARGEILSAEAIEALMRLKTAQDNGDILVARTSRLLEYASTRDYLRFEVKAEADGKTVIDITGIDDPVRGLQAPLMRKLRGITFEVPGEGPVEIRFRGSPLGPNEIVETQLAGKKIVGIKWFPADHRDYVLERRDQVAVVLPPRPKTRAKPPADAAAGLTSRIAAWLDRQAEACPENIAKDKHEYALDYAKGRYAIGLDHYQRLFHEIGWSGKRHGLDIGGGAGHWALAFALDNERAEGIDPSEAFVNIANGTAAEAGLADRVHHKLGRAESLPFPDRSFDAAWSHSVLMYGDIEDAISEVARVLEPGGEFYCGYSSTGFRLSGVYAGITSRRKDFLRSQLYNYIGGSLQHDGMARTPWSSIRFATSEELATVCGVFGLSLVRQPGLQDGLKDFAGIPATIDLLCVRDSDGKNFRDRLFDLSAKDERDRCRYRELICLGLGKMARRVLEERGESLSDPDIRSLYVLAGVKAGRGNHMIPLVAQGIDPLTQGLHAFDCRRMEEAITAFSELPADHRDRSFLLGAARLFTHQPEAAAAEFERGFDAGHRPVECGFGAMLASLDSAEPQELAQRMARVLRRLPDALGASPQKIEEFVETLAAGR